ncbi:unnamed protein product [Clonostachys rosea]|uniref:Amino acid permease/ SLC12A domain-containing protein n=1 Tax=Bionectria ochroleuca TaxID=29856 RepID=A0ABY6TU90_BIOOC|nr:unnamed protein product [Clonostachys rosea]
MSSSPSQADDAPIGAKAKRPALEQDVKAIESQHFEGQTQKPFTTLSAMSIGANTTNSAIGVILTLSIWLPYGGPAFTVYSYLAMALVGTATAISLSELASAMPDAGGQYIWVAKLSPARCRRFLSYLTALISWAGAVCTGASATLACPELAVALAEFLNPGVQVPSWQVFVGYQAVNWLSVVPGLFESVIPRMGKFMMFYTLFVLVFIFIGLFAASKERQPTSVVFTGFSNDTGWPAGVAVLIGMNSPNWCFSCLDTIVHIAEEVPNPRKNLPKAIMWTIPIGLITGLLVLLSGLFNMDDSGTQSSYFQIAYAAFGSSTSAAIAVQVLIFMSAFSAQAHIHIWQSRLAWTIGINHGFPFDTYLSKIVGAPFHTPVWATLFSALWTTLLGVVYVGSKVAFSSLISCGILFQYISYSIPVILLLAKGRSVEHGPFWLCRTGLVANIAMICWTVLATVIYSLPYTLPADIDTMNYVSVIICGFMLLIVAIWFGVARKRWTVPHLTG